jgi:hypothetical protein
MGLNEIRAIKGAAHLYPDKKAVKRSITQPAPEKEKQPPPKRSDKMKDIVALLRKGYARFLKKNPFCKIKSPVCTKVATVINHTRGRTEDVILDEAWWEASCPACNGYIEEHDAWARKHGHKVSKFK